MCAKSFHHYDVLRVDFCINNIISHLNSTFHTPQEQKLKTFQISLIIVNLTQFFLAFFFENSPIFIINYFVFLLMWFSSKKILLFIIVEDYLDLKSMKKGFSFRCIRKFSFSSSFHQKKSEKSTQQFHSFLRFF